MGFSVVRAWAPELVVVVQALVQALVRELVWEWGLALAQELARNQLRRSRRHKPTATQQRRGHSH